MKKIKMIWDFRGANAFAIAKHHAQHLEEFADEEALEDAFSGTEQLNPMHCLAYLVVPESYVLDLRPRLKPHRGQWYTS